MSASTIKGVKVEVIWADGRRFGGVHLNDAHSAYIETENESDGWHVKIESNLSKARFTSKHLVLSQAVRQAITAMIDAESVGV